MEPAVAVVRVVVAEAAPAIILAVVMRQVAVEMVVEVAVAAVPVATEAEVAEAHTGYSSLQPGAPELSAIQILYPAQLA
jgi:hypothetical protein